MNRILLCFVAAAASMLCHQAGECRLHAAETLTYAALVNRMIDLEHLAVLPAAGETCAQWSSYDRTSRYDADSGKYVGWGANRDGIGFIRKEAEQIVMAEMEGPGCIWRIWSARAQQGHVRIYLDGQKQPTVDLPFSEYFDAQHAPFTYPLLSYRLEDIGSKGQNLYYPVPYQKSCKIVADPGWGQYYHFTYSTFPKGTRVPTFTGKLDAESAAALKRVNDFLQNGLGSDPAEQRNNASQQTSVSTVAPGQTAKVAELTGPAAITSIRVKKMDWKDREDQMAALRKLAIRITWDDQTEPAVWCPLGDFFGTAPGENHYKSLLTGMTDDGYYALWYMPFAKRALVELVNDDTVARSVPFEISRAELKRPFQELGYFHCKWHRDVFPLSDDRKPDWVMLQTQGCGRFCGVMLHIWNPRGRWWGEGDEKFFVDGEKFPSTFGTGSEDYFGYAWCWPALFQRPFHCQTMTEDNRGHQSVLRWHVADNVPFQSSFEGCIEKYFANQRPTLYAATVCWYLAPGGKDPFGSAPVANRHGYYVAPEAGGLTVLGSPPGNVQSQNLSPRPTGKWKDDDQLWWTKAKPGDKLDLGWKVEKGGRYAVSVTLTKAKDYGIVQLYVDGQKAGGPIDLYNPAVVPSGPLALGNFELTPGEHKLTVEIIGANEKAVKSYMFGIDEVLAEPVK